ncbi:hypothetical protein JMM81_12340 [Bacillus sp. V3B]|nr:hypothetical protein [Bacillus sp. V3B]MCQ6275745.1 hypothetical protein [Bacillus sp. V3B]
MPRENKRSQNTIKFSIWETRTDKSHAAIEKSPEITEKLNPKSNKKDS